MTDPSAFPDGREKTVSVLEKPLQKPENNRYINSLYGIFRPRRQRKFGCQKRSWQRIGSGIWFVHFVLNPNSLIDIIACTRYISAGLESARGRPCSPRLWSDLLWCGRGRCEPARPRLTQQMQRQRQRGHAQPVRTDVETELGDPLPGRAVLGEIRDERAAHQRVHRGAHERRRLAGAFR